jgi:hypothetical protein
MRIAFVSMFVTVVSLSFGCQGETVGVSSGDSGLDAEDTPDAADAPDTGPKLAGQTCNNDKDCDPSGTNGATCLKQAATPICAGAHCSPVTADPTLSPCGTDGVCLDDGAGKGSCVAMCLFDGKSDTLTIGCTGKNVCFYVGAVVRDSVGYGYGRCEGGCAADGDCPAGTQCQVELGACVATLTTFPGAIGDACVAADDGVKCGCVYGLGTKTGYCSRVCRFGETTCPSGGTCDPTVPKSFSTVPKKGMMGYCLKDCTVDTECTNGYCEENAGIGHKTCQPGAR